nr:hypothetical protein [Tanacetum cinerariifolium]
MISSQPIHQTIIIPNKKTHTSLTTTAPAIVKPPPHLTTTKLTTTSPPQRHHHQRNPNTTAPHPHSDTSTTGVTTIECHLHREINHHRPRPPRPTPTKRIFQVLRFNYLNFQFFCVLIVTAVGESVAVGNTAVAPKKLLPPLLTILYCQSMMGWYGWGCNVAERVKMGSFYRFLFARLETLIYHINRNPQKSGSNSYMNNGRTCFVVKVRPVFEKYYNSIQAFLEKRKEEVTLQEEGSKRKGNNLNQNAVKKYRIDENKAELKAHLQIVVDDADDVFTGTTPLATKVHVFYYQIHHENNKPYYKIIRADGTHKLFLSFITLLKNFGREDLEMLWKLVQERFQYLEPKNFSDDFLLNTLKIMFEKPNVKANIWRDQKSIYGLAKVKSWKLFESCGVYIITLTTTQMILLVEKKYPLTYFTLEQMLNNVRLKVEEESEMSLELLRLMRRQLQEGYILE